MRHRHPAEQIVLDAARRVKVRRVAFRARIIRCPEETEPALPSNESLVVKILCELDDNLAVYFVQPIRQRVAAELVESFFSNAARPTALRRTQDRMNILYDFLYYSKQTRARENYLTDRRKFRATKTFGVTHRLTDIQSAL
ncbi:MAG: hypothetical protein WA723_09380 [Pseudolabrys sp.]